MVLFDDQSGNIKTLALTRRLTGRIVNALAQVLKKSSNAPSEMQDDIILLEHQVALQDRQSSASSQASGERLVKSKQVLGAGPVHLVHAVQIVSKTEGFVFVFLGPQHPLATMNLSRKDLHRLLEAISLYAHKVDWDIPVDVSWLNPDLSKITVN
ncbi:hypothetical protein [Pseudosulfitobacter pseudonitzschiae]|uniref:hypothetical protein n=1 Tax=Pseudosulfitobacter pseudonitzschiae TaxID=1402135 RepID=UPI001AF62565|nr:hypothetical protein [Pseudosulfitobacter pseudonitzschiae]MBM1817402.1 hypothetical protein [Pseudosulfitobacter pseudonitzschiae]MBM1834600.1 hypothetical protein [Pseudosulfitobacter pseudonitzschiae]MBM1839464.1 hypothetical protein [Pseudosulfitobacter pseudonitzschiae]MBM1844315.1 hypothetical protein [Pseudosulfitobacter pseudonitzschiae]MBM1849149.1 hypothetical protein [Pseudosulfitobacter pseudonitzschiae]